MKKTATSARKPAAKARSSAHKPKSAVRSRATSASTSAKGIRHHAKRLYHGTPKFIHGMVVGGTFGLLVVGFLGGSFAHPSFTNALTSGNDSQACQVKRVGTNDVGGVDSRFILNSNGSVTARFQVTGTGCRATVTLVAWNAPNSTDGKPYSAQTLYSKVTGSYAPGGHTITTTIPNCYYQVDLMTGSEIPTTPGSPTATPDRQRGSLHGGIQACSPNTPPTTPSTQPTSTTLPNTGPGAVILVFVLALAGGYIFHVTHHHRQRRLAHPKKR